MRTRTLIVALAAFIFLAASGMAAPNDRKKTLGMAKPLRLKAVKPDKTAAPVFQRITLHVDLEAAYNNPFNSKQIRVEAKITPAAGGNWMVPGFLYQPYARRLDGNREKMEPAGKPEWQVRLSLPKPGKYSVVVSATDHGGKTESPALMLEGLPGDSPGMVRRHPTDHRYFVTDRGETFFLVGANVCWGGASGTFSYDKWLPKYAENGCNFFRVWLNPDWVTFAMNARETGFDHMNLANAWRLDYVLEEAERLGLRVMFCIDSFNILKSKKTEYGQWEDSPYIEANGGPCAEPSDYFANPRMREAYRDRLRYLVARYGYSPSVFAWEFWNEVELIDHYDSKRVTPWHRDMAQYLRALDPWKHLISTSFAMPKGDPNVNGLPELDFVQTHHYQSKDMARDLGEDRRAKAAAESKPHFHGEFGITNSNRTGEMDPTGIYLHNGLYSCVGQLQAGTPMTWWWDSYIGPKNLYPMFGAFSRWIKGFDFVAQDPRPIDARVRYASKPKSTNPEDPIWRPAAVAWKDAPCNKPANVTVTNEGELIAKDAAQPSANLHGIANHPTWHNPVTFEMDVPKKCKFGVIVEGVSGHGGAALEVTRDGKVVLKKQFKDTDPGTDTLNKYNRTYEVKLTKGHHIVKVENPGADWVSVAYKIPWLEPVPPLRVLGLQGKTKALLWVQNRAYTWFNVAREKKEPEPTPPCVLRIEGLPRNKWIIEEWDTQKGEVSKTATVAVGANGDIEIALPALVHDAAFRLTAAD